MKCWELDNFKDFENEVIAKAEKEGKETVLKAKNEAKALLKKAEEEGKKLKDTLLKEKLSELEREFEKRKKELKRKAQEEKERIEKELFERVKNDVLKKINLDELFSCFKEKVSRKYGKGKFLKGKGEELFKFVSKEVTVVFTVKDIEEIVAEEVKRWLK